MGSMFCKTVCVQRKNTVCKKTASWHLLFAIAILHGVGQDKERHGEALFTQLIHKSHTLKIVGRREKGGVQMSELEWRVFMGGGEGRNTARVHGNHTAGAKVLSAYWACTQWWYTLSSPHGADQVCLNANIPPFVYCKKVTS